METDFQIRRAGPADAALIAAHRRWMFADAGDYDPNALAAMEARFLEWLPAKLAKDEYLGWFVVTPAGEAVAGVGLWVQEWTVNPNNLSGRRGHVVNVYTLPGHRRRGLAQALMRELLAWCREHDVLSLFLNSTDEARPLYRSLGFEIEDTMSIWLSGGNP